MIDFTEDMRIKGWNSPSKGELIKLKMVAENQFDKYNRPNWIWPDYPGGEPVYSPQPYTPEQTEQLRKEWCRAEIEKLYPVDVQMKILTETMIEPTEKFKTMQADRLRIITESKTKDFQISEG